MRPTIRTGAAVAALVAGLGLAVTPVAAAPPDSRAPAVPAHASGSPFIEPVRTVRVPTPTLTGRATLSADFQAPGPPSGAKATPANGRTGPFPGQVIPGFSGMVNNGDGTFWGLPDNGFGTKANSADFLLRMYLIRPRFETADGGSGEIRVRRFVSLRDPDRKIGFPIVNGDTRERLLTGADFDVESVVRAPDGSFWIGEEFGPFLLHVSASGRLLQAPVPFPDASSPDNPLLPPGQAPTLGRSRGFEALAGSRDGRRLYPIVEGAFTADPDQRRRWIYEFDTVRNRYTGKRWAYQTDAAANVIGDAYLTGNRQLVVLERDDFDGPAAVIKRVYRVDLGRRDGNYVAKRLHIDLLKIANPNRIGLAASPGAYGVGREFAFPFQSVEVILPLSRNRLLVGNDNNYPGNDARYEGTPDDTELVTVDIRRRRAETGGPLVIAHRGASGYRPEHTLAAYALAIRQCADYIEPDLVPTKDGVLVARHENEIGGTTNVGDKAEFSGRKTTKSIDGVNVTGWFTEDFTLAELRTLRAKERIPALRPSNTAYDGLYPVPTLDEVVDLARHSRTCDGKRVGVYPETKHPTYFANLGLALERPLVRTLEENGYGDAGDPVYLQSFETANLRRLNRLTDLPVVQLINCSGAPYDLVVAGDPRTYADLASRAGLRRIARYADGVGLCKDVMIPRDAEARLTRPTRVIRDAHAAGLEVHGWTFRRENAFLPRQFRVGTEPAGVGDLTGEIEVFLAAGMDGFFTDNPDVGVAAARR